MRFDIFLSKTHLKAEATKLPEQKYSCLGTSLTASKTRLGRVLEHIVHSIIYLASPSR